MPALRLGKLFDLPPPARSIERRAWECLQLCRERLGLDRIKVPVPVEQCIETGLRIGFGIGDLSCLGDGILGAAYIKDREIVIDQRTLKNEGRYRFTCAHELGHMILHARRKVVFRDGETNVLSRAPLVERQADQFAASFLMPVAMFEEALLQICDDHKLDYTETLPELAVETKESEDLWVECFLPEITNRFAVSLPAALIRCGELRIKAHRFDPLLSRPRMKRIWGLTAERRRAAGRDRKDSMRRDQMLLFDA